MSKDMSSSSTSPPSAPLEPITFLSAPLLPTECPMPGAPLVKGERDQLRDKFDVSLERVLVGEAREHLPIVSRGAWGVSDSGLEPPERTLPAEEVEPETFASPGGERIVPAPTQFWAPRVKGGLVDGLTRARFAVGERLDYDVVLRGVLDADKKQVVDGWGVVMRGATLWLVRYTQEGARQVSPIETIYKLERRDHIELLAYTLGDHLHVQVHDADNGVELLSLQVEDRSIPKSGLLAIGAPPTHNNPPSSRLVHLSTRAACAASEPPAHVEQRPPRVFLVLADSQHKSLPERARAHLDARERSATHRDARHYQTDAVGMEAVYCAGARALESSAEIPWKYIDAEYLAYKQRAPVKDATGIRVDLSYKNPQMVQALMRAFHEAHPEITRIEQIGRSHRGHPILAMAIANDLQVQDSRPSILLNSAHHGDEPISTEIAFDAMKYLLDPRIEDPRRARWLDEVVTWIVPQVNPDGAENFLEQSFRMGRKNGRELDGAPGQARDEGVDLNRNYPFRWHSLGEEGSSSQPPSPYYRGASPGSEPETKAMMALAERERFAGSISYHTGTVCILAPYTIDEVENPEPNEAWEVGEALSRAMPRHPEGRAFKLKKNLYPVDGTDQDWFRAEHGTLAILVEAVRRTPKNYCARAPVVEANRQSWILFYERFLDGPTLTGVVRGPDGAPVEAEVSIVEQKLRAGEVWTSRPRDGRYARFLSKPGTYTVRVKAKGFKPYTKRARVTAGAVTTLDVTLEPSGEDDST